VPHRKILVVEDDPVILDLLTTNFELEGFEVARAVDGVEGLQMARIEQPHAVVADIMMPRMSGLQLLEALKSDPDTSSIPVVFVSAKAQADDIRAGLDAGADDYVTKPFDPGDLVELITKLTDR
jgi:DNA-binding response OmpR family regulator